MNEEEEATGRSGRLRMENGDDTHKGQTKS